MCWYWASYSGSWRGVDKGACAGIGPRNLEQERVGGEWRILDIGFRMLEQEQGRVGD